MRITNIVKRYAIALAFLSCNQSALADSTDKGFQILVERLYARYAWEQGPDPDPNLNGITLIQEELGVLKQYFTNELAKAINTDYTQQFKTGEIGHLDFVILYASQDPSVIDLSIKSLDESHVQACYKHLGTQEICMIFVGEKQDAQYKIRDIEYERGYSLRTLLKL